MLTRRKTIMLLTISAMLLVSLVGCGATATPTATAVPTKGATSAPTSAPASAPTAAPTKVPPTATAVPPTPTQGPTVGGTLKLAVNIEPDSLDPHKTSQAVASTITSYLGASLLARDKDGKFVGYLADSWTMSDDSLTWTFKLKKGVKFSDGSAFTAKDYVYTLQRALDPKQSTGAVKGMLSAIKSSEAPDDSTLVLHLNAPHFPLMLNLASSGYVQALSQAAVDKAGDQFGRHPVGLGPMVLKEWVTGQGITLERNPDFNWGPSFAHQGPWYIQTISIRFIAENATMLAGLESGELDGYLFNALDVKDVPRIKDTGRFQIFQQIFPGMFPFMYMNVAKAPFDDVRVRQAFNLAVDKDTVIKVIALGNASPQYGPLSNSMTGYSADVEKIGYKFDLAKAKQLMKDAGYVAGADGILSKDGKPLSFVLYSYPTEPFASFAAVLQQQYKALGVAVTLQQAELGVLTPKLKSGDYDLCVLRISYTDADLLYMMFHSSQMNVLNYSQVKDADLDKLLEATRTTLDPVKRQEAVNAVVNYLVQKAFIVTIYSPINFYPMSTKVKGVVFSPLTGMYLNDAYIAK